MSRIPSLLDSIRAAVDDIERAIRSHFIETENVPLSEYGNIIRNLKKGNGGDSAIIPIKLTMVAKPKVLTGVVLYDYTPIKILTREKHTKTITGAVIHDYAPKSCYVAAYEPINLATLAITTLELEDDDYVQESTTLKEEI